MTFATDYQTGDAYDRFLKGLASMDMQLERNGMKRSLNPTDIRTAPVRRAGRQSFNLSKAATSFKATLSVWKKPMTEV